MPDLGAELQGYRNELANVGEDGERGKAVRKEIDRVRKAIGERADELDNEAGEHDEAGQDVPAAQARVEARRYRAMLDDDGPEDTAESKPQEKAVPRRSGSRKSE